MTRDTIHLNRMIHTNNYTKRYIVTILVTLTSAYCEDPNYISNKYFTTIQNRSYETDSLTFHDMSVVNIAFSSYGNTNNTKLDFFGISYGHRYVDISASLANFSTSSTYGGSVIAPFAAGLGLGIWSYQEANLIDTSHHSLVLYAVCIPMALRAPEIRLFPISPIQMICGYEYDLKYSGKTGFTNQLTFRYGIGLNLKLLRAKFFKYQPALWGDKTPGYGWEVDLFTFDLNTAMSV